MTTSTLSTSSSSENGKMPTVLNGDDFYEIISSDIIYQYILEGLPTKMFCFIPKSIEEVETIFMEEYKQNEYLEITIPVYEESKIKLNSQLILKREELIKLYQVKVFHDSLELELQHTKKTIKTLKEYLELLKLSSNFFNVNKIGCLNGLFLWNHYPNNPIFYTKLQDELSDLFSNSSLPKMSVDDIRTMNYKNSSSSKKPPVQEKVIVQTLSPKANFTYQKLKDNSNNYENLNIVKNFQNYTHSKVLEIYYCTFNLASLYIKKFALKVKEDKKLYHEMKNEKTNDIYQKTLQLLSLKAVDYLTECRKILYKNKSIFESLRTELLNDFYKETINDNFLLETKNVIIHLFGQVLMLNKAILRTRGLEIKDKKTQCPYLIMSIIGYIQEEIIKSNILTSTIPKMIFGTSLIPVFSILLNLYASYLSFVGFFQNRTITNKLDTYIAESLFHLELAKKHIIRVKKEKEETLKKNEQEKKKENIPLKQILSDFLFYPKNDEKLKENGKKSNQDNYFSEKIFCIIETLIEKVDDLNREVYRQVRINCNSEEEVKNRKKPLSENLEIYKFKKFIPSDDDIFSMNDNNSIHSWMSQSQNQKEENVKAFNSEQFIQNLTIFLKGYPMIPNEFLCKKLSDFV